MSAQDTMRGRATPRGPSAAPELARPARHHALPATVPARRSRARSGLALAGVLAFAALVLGVPAGRTPVWDPNEARFLLLARDILEHGRWLLPDLRGEAYVNKPQLFFWSVAVASIPGGDVTARSGAVPAVLSSLAMVAAVYVIGSRAWGLGTGAVAGLALASTAGFFLTGHHAQADVMVGAWTWWGLSFLFQARREDFARAPLGGFYACVALAILSKGPMGLIGLAGGIAAIAAVDGWSAMRRLRPLLGLVIMALLLSPWYGPYLLAHRSEFVGGTVVGHYGSWVFRRGVLTRLESLWVLAYGLPWTLFLAGAVLWWRRTSDPERRAIAVATAVIWALIGFSGIHRPRYLIPIYPGLALLAAEFVTRAAARGGARLLRGAAYAVAGGAAMLALFVASPLPRLIDREGQPYVPDTSGEVVLVVALLLGAGAAVLVAARRSAFTAAGLIVTLGTGAVLVVEGARYPTRFAQLFDVRPVAAAAAALTPPGAAVPVYPDIWLSYDFYMRRPVAEIDHTALEQLLSGPARGAVVTTRKAWAAFASRAHPSWRVVASHRAGHRQMVVLGGE